MCDARWRDTRGSWLSSAPVAKQSRPLACFFRNAYFPNSRKPPAMRDPLDPGLVLGRQRTEFARGSPSVSDPRPTTSLVWPF
jgi:hypothetical protein